MFIASITQIHFIPSNQDIIFYFQNSFHLFLLHCFDLINIFK